MVFDTATITTIISQGSLVDVMAYIAQNTFAVSILSLWLIPAITTFLMALVSGSVRKPHFWVLFIFPQFIAFIIVVLILSGFLPAWTSMT